MTGTWRAGIKKAKSGCSVMGIPRMTQYSLYMTVGTRLSPTVWILLDPHLPLVLVCDRSGGYLTSEVATGPETLSRSGGVEMHRVGKTLRPSPYSLVRSDPQTN